MSHPSNLWRNVFVLVAGAAILFTGTFAYQWMRSWNEVVIDRPIPSQTDTVPAVGTGAQIPSSEDAIVTSQLPPRVRITVPFQSQAPLGNWEMPYQEACEEASLILVHHYLEGTSVNAAQMDQEILDLVAFEIDKLGYNADTTAAQQSTLAKEYYGYDAKLVENPSIDDIKKELAAGNPVIVPLAGRMLGNPYYSGEGPWYHVLVITGYDEKNFITNDVGTRRGEGYKYTYNTIMNALHDWTGVKEDITSGRKVMLVVTK